MSRKAFYGSGTAPNTVPNYSVSTRWVENGSFVRFRQLTLAYSLDRRWIPWAGLSALRLYVTFQNMFVISGYKGYSPELNVTSSANSAFTQEGLRP